jgi:hypothetical protein
MRVALLCVSLLFLLGCDPPPQRTYTVTDHQGNVYRGQFKVSSGYTHATFRDAEGKRLYVMGNASYVEER